jgi:hypothetical protein
MEFKPNTTNNDTLSLLFNIKSNIVSKPNNASDEENELYFLKSSYYENNKRLWISGKKMSDDEKLLIGIIED